MKGDGLSVAIIACNEEDRIGDAIRSAKFADEVIVLDSGSQDGTVALAKSLGARVMQTDWPGYVVQKNRAITFAKHNWILSIDADERISPELAVSVQDVLAKGSTFSGFKMARRHLYLGQWIRFCGWYPNWQLRLFRRDQGQWVGMELHEQVEIQGRVQKVNGDLLHEPYRNLSDQLSTINRYSTLFAREAQAKGRRARWWDIVFRPPLFFVKRYLFSFGFLDGIHGLIVCGMGAFYMFSRWVKLFELQKGLAKHP